MESQPFPKPLVHALTRALAVLLLLPGAIGASEAAPDWSYEVSGSGLAARGWNAEAPSVDAPSGRAARYAIATDGQHFSPARETAYEVKLRAGHFDPLLQAPPALPSALRGRRGESLYIVQFMTHPLEAYRNVLRSHGAEILFFLADHAQIVRMDAAIAEELRSLPFVRWIGVLEPGHRLEPFLIGRIARGAALDDDYNVMLVESSRAVKERVAAEIEVLGGEVLHVHDGKYLLRARLDADTLADTARLDDVLFIDRWSPYESDMDRVREVGGANYVETVPGGYTGEGVRGEVFDTGFNLSHVDFGSRPLIEHGATNSDSHGASTSGIVFGDGTGNATARGLLPDGQGIVADDDTIGLSGPARYDHTGELREAPYFAVFQTASVGSARTFDYTTISADTDAALFDFDVVHCQSQSNAGNQDSRPQAWAKNIISGGGVYHFDTLDRSDDSWAGGGSTGPATDGRIKPDLAHFYDSVFTVTTGSDTAYNSGFGGTSAATPIICGHVGLFFDMWADGAFGNPVDGTGDAFSNRSHMATAKAMMINSASPWDWTAGGANGDIDRFRQGWGMPDLRAMYDRRGEMLIVDETRLLEDLGDAVYVFDVAPGEPDLRITLVFTDPPGIPNSDQHRVNNLSLRVTSPTGEIFWGNHGLRDGLWSIPGGSENRIDTVENVFVEAPAFGEWTLEILASEVVQDSHVETPAVDADFALVATGGVETVPTLYLRLLSELPDLQAPRTPLDLEVEIRPGVEGIVPGTETLVYRLDAGDDGTRAPLANQGNSKYIATLPGADCTSPQFYFEAEATNGEIVTLPRDAPTATFRFETGTIVTGWSDDFEADLGWAVTDTDVQTGGWVRAVPSGGGLRGDPPSDFDGSGQCYVTGNAIDEDLDGGPTELLSPIFDATEFEQPVLRYARWFTNDDADIDSLEIDLSNDGGGAWVRVETIGGGSGWVDASVPIADFLTPTSTMRLRLRAADQPNDSVTEAALDAVRVEAQVCRPLCVESANGYIACGPVPVP